MNEIQMDIALNAGFMIAKGNIDIGDSREFICCVIPSLAEEFYKIHDMATNPQLENYMALVDQFSEEKLKELYGTERPETEDADIFEVIRWSHEDIYCALENRDIPKTEENLKIFLNSYAPNALHERCVTEGNEVINILVSDLKEQFKMNLSDEEITKQLIDIYWSEGTLDYDILEEWNDFLESNFSQLFSPTKALLDIYFENDEQITENVFESIGILTEVIRNQLKSLEPEYFEQTEKEYHKKMGGTV